MKKAELLTNPLAFESAMDAAVLGRVGRRRNERLS